MGLLDWGWATRGAELVAIGGHPVYAVVAVAGRATRLRVSADECDRLDLFAGRQVRIRLPGRPAVGALVTAVTADPPFPWAVVELATAAAVRRAGRRTVGAFAGSSMTVNVAGAVSGRGGV